MFWNSFFVYNLEFTSICSIIKLVVSGSEISQGYFILMSSCWIKVSGSVYTDVPLNTSKTQNLLDRMPDVSWINCLCWSRWVSLLTNNSYCTSSASDSDSPLTLQPGLTIELLYWIPSWGPFTFLSLPEYSRKYICAKYAFKIIILYFSHKSQRNIQPSVRLVIKLYTESYVLHGSLDMLITSY